MYTQRYSYTVVIVIFKILIKRIKYCDCRLQAYGCNTERGRRAENSRGQSVPDGSTNEGMVRALEALTPGDHSTVGSSVLCRVARMLRRERPSRVSTRTAVQR